MTSTAIYRYRLRSMGDSSAKYGPCEVCGKPASEVFHQVEQERYEYSQWTEFGCRGYFGHEACLKGVRRDGTKREARS